MLNKPTNVSPYNEFVDINNGLELNFSLNNVVDGVCIEVYNEDNTPVFSDLITNTEKRRDFTYTIPDKSLLSNDKNYYWKVRYWNEPQEEDKFDNDFICINYHNTIKGTIGLFPNYKYFQEQGGYITHSESNETSSAVAVGSWDDCRALYLKGFQLKEINGNNFVIYDPDELISNLINYTVFSRSGAGENKFLVCFPDKQLYAQIYNSFSSSTIEGLGITISESSFNKEGPLYDWFEESTCYDIIIVPLSLYNSYKYLWEPKDGFYDKYNNRYISLRYGKNSVVYKMKSYTGDDLYSDCIPYIGMVVNSPYFPILEEGETYCVPEESVTYYGDVSTYSKCEYNTSPPYYFSCVENPSNFISFGDISESSPQVKLSTNIEKYFDINSYRYQVYQLIGTNNWKLLWESDKLNSITVLDDGTYDTETVVYKGISPSNSYRAKLIGQTSDGIDFEIEKGFTSTDFIVDAITEDFVSFDKDLGCIKIDESVFIVPEKIYELDVYRYNILKKEINFVFNSSLSINMKTISGGYCKVLSMYDFNIICDAEYIYYAFIMDKDGNTISSYVSNPITPSWDGVYLNDVVYTSSAVYKPDVSKVWFIGLNLETGETNRSYQVSHPYGIGQKHPKSIRGKGISKTGQLSGLLGTISCTSGDYDEDVYLIDRFEDFCSNGKLKLIRSNVKGEHLIADIDKMSSSEFGQVATSINVAYTQIDDIMQKQISIEV